MKNEEMITIPKAVYESEKKMRFFGGNAEDIYKKKYNIFIGISISNKKITSDMALNYLKWAIRNTKEKVAVVIADELNIVNYKILDKYSAEKSKKKAQKVGTQFKKLFKEAQDKLSDSEKHKIEIYMWTEVKENKHYKEVRDFLETQFKNDEEFKSAILYFIRKYMRKKGRVITDENKINQLATYILGELPTLLEGLMIKEEYYQLCIYPTYFASGMSQFVMDIHAQELSIGKKLNRILKNKAILVEAWLD